MIVERFHPDKVKALYQRFDERGRLLPEGVHYIDSWIDASVSICFQLMESESRALLDAWITKWHDLATFEVHEIISSPEAKKRALAH